MSTLQRDESRLELLSKTAAWKNEVEGEDSPSNRISPILNNTTGGIDIPRVASTVNQGHTTETASTSTPSLSLTQQRITSFDEAFNFLPQSHSFCSDYGHHQSLSPIHDSAPTPHHTITASVSSPLPSIVNLTARPASLSTFAPHGIKQQTPKSFLPPAFETKKSYKDLEEENKALRNLLAAKDDKIEELRAQVCDLEDQIQEFRQLPTGKISQIPIDQMLSIMQEYGSEISGLALPPRKGDVKRSSIIRQFRRWNPNFFQYFKLHNGEWVPKLGKQGELKRRMEMRGKKNKNRST